MCAGRGAGWSCQLVDGVNYPCSCCCLHHTHHPRHTAAPLHKAHSPEGAFAAVLLPSSIRGVVGAAVAVAQGEVAVQVHPGAILAAGELPALHGRTAYRVAVGHHLGSRWWGKGVAGACVLLCEGGGREGEDGAR